MATDSSRMPAIFFGHGNPLNALAQNDWSRAWARIGRAIPRPQAILCISAHWYMPATCVTAQPNPRTIHDFGGFPRALFEVEYPAPGSPDLAARVQELLAPTVVAQDQEWGLDHGTWSVLIHVYPQANIPVVQLSIDETQPAHWHFEIARRLVPLREEGVLIMGSGNLVHNLHAYGWGKREIAPYDWALRFELLARQSIQAIEFEPLIAYETLGRDAMLCAPTPDHYLPLIYILAQHQAGEAVSFPVEGFDGGSISMLSVQFG
jgi:4,5-DOPA dioxygenase extradiol